MKKIFSIILLLFISTNFLLAEDSNLTLDIDKSELKKINIIFEDIDYIGDSGSSKPIDIILNTIKKNLKTTGLFVIDDTGKSIFDDYEEVKSLSKTDLTNLVMSKYSQSKVDAVLSGYMEVNNKGEIELKIRLWDILDQRELFAKYYIINDANAKRIGDIISDNIYEPLTGEISGHFDSKIIFVAESGSPKNRIKKIAIMDFDGSNLHYITNGKNLVLTPVFSKYSKNEILYLEYGKYKPNLYQLNLKTNHLTAIGNPNEMSYAPNFNPNGRNEMVFSATRNGLSNIYKINFNTKKIDQLTFDRAISTVPTWSPDGEKILFVSDKTGIRKLYTMNKDGSNVKMISKGRGSYDKPSWSPDGKLVSFVKMENDIFSIGLMTPKGDSERTIMSAYLVEGIKWSPNGRYLIYSKQKGPYGKDSIPGLYTMDILTGLEYKLQTPANQGATDPDWIKK